MSTLYLKKIKIKTKMVKEKFPWLTINFIAPSNYGKSMRIKRKLSFKVSKYY